VPTANAKADVNAHVGPERETPGSEGVIPNTAIVSKEGCRMRERRVWRPARKPAVAHSRIGQSCSELSEAKQQRSRGGFGRRISGDVAQGPAPELAVLVCLPTIDIDRYRK
jgi:hypothetical protein